MRAFRCGDVGITVRLMSQTSGLAEPDVSVWPALVRARAGDLAFSTPFLDVLPAALYVTDADGRITYFNDAAAALWGCRPKLKSDRWCGSWRLYRPDGSPMPHDECPMAVALK